MGILTRIISWWRERGRVSEENAASIGFVQDRPGRLLCNPGQPSTPLPLFEKRKELIARLHERLANGENVSHDEIRECIFMEVEGFLSNTTTVMNERLVWVAPILKYKPEMAEELFTYFFEVNLIDTFCADDYDAFVRFAEYYLEYSSQTNEQIREYFKEQGHRGIIWYPMRVNTDGRDFLANSLRSPEIKLAIESAITKAKQKLKITD